MTRAHLKGLHQCEVHRAETGLCAVPGEVLCTGVAWAVTAHTSVINLKQSKKQQDADMLKALC